MLLEIALAIAAASLAFAIGFAVRRGSICAVAATQLWIVRGYTMRIRAFIVAAAASGAIILPLSWVVPNHANLSFGFPIGVTTVAAALLFAIGARINNACGFGTLAHLSGGRLEYLGTVVGMVSGAILAQRFRGTIPEASISPLADFSLPAAAAWITMVLLSLPALKLRHFRNLRSALGPDNTVLRPFTAMLIIGSLGGILYSLAGSWTYLAVIEKQAIVLGGGMLGNAVAASAISGALSMLAGAIFAAWRSGKFKLRNKPLSVWLRHLVAGLSMGSAAALIPGGNGALIVFGVPSGALNAIAAIIVIKALLAASFLPDRQRFRQKHAQG